MIVASDPGSRFLTWPGPAPRHPTRVIALALALVAAFAPAEVEADGPIRVPTGKGSRCDNVLKLVYPVVDAATDRYWESFPPIEVVTGAAPDRIMFQDRLPRSLAVSWAYRVAAVNRWGVIGEPATVMVEVPSTAPPAAPTLLSVVATEDGNLRIEARASCPLEDVGRYELWRRREPRRLVPVPGAAGAAAAAAGAAAAVAAAGNQASAGSQAARRVGSRASGAGGGPARLASGRLAFGSFDLDAPFVEHARRLLDLRFELQAVAPEEVTDGEDSVVRFLDRDVVPEERYWYAVLAVSRGGVASPFSVPMDGAPIRAFADPPTVTESIALPDAVTLRWTVPGRTGNSVVERIQGDASACADLAPQRWIQLSDLLPASAASFVDRTAYPGRTYTYRVRTKDLSGRVSRPACEARAAGEGETEVAALAVAERVVRVPRGLAMPGAGGAPVGPPVGTPGGR